MPETESTGCRLWYTTDGPPAAPPLLLANSLGTTAELWNRTVAALDGRFQVIRYDTRGHGRSAAPPGPYSLATLGHDALAVLDAVAIDSAHVAGISLGGQTAIWLGIHAPSRVRRLVLANTGAQIGAAASWNERIDAVTTQGMAAIADGLLGRWFTEAFREQHPEITAEYRAMIAGCTATGYAGCCAAVRDADLRPDLHQITARTLVIVGAHDPATPPAAGRLIQERIPNARLAVLAAAHLSNVEQPEQFAALVAAFLA